MASCCEVGLIVMVRRLRSAIRAPSPGCCRAACRTGAASRPCAAVSAAACGRGRRLRSAPVRRRTVARPRRRVGAISPGSTEAGLAGAGAASTARQVLSSKAATGVADSVEPLREGSDGRRLGAGVGFGTGAACAIGRGLPDGLGLRRTHWLLSLRGTLSRRAWLSACRRLVGRSLSATRGAVQVAQRRSAIGQAWSLHGTGRQVGRSAARTRLKSSASALRTAAGSPGGHRSPSTIPTPNTVPSERNIDGTTHPLSSASTALARSHVLRGSRLYPTPLNSGKTRRPIATQFQALPNG